VTRTVFGKSLPVAVTLVALAATAATAQPAAPAGAIEVGGGLLWRGETAFGSSDAALTTGTGSAFRLFSTSSTLASRAGLEGRVGFPVWRALEAEAFGSFARPTLRTTVANDVEGAADVTALETVTQYTVGGGLLWYLPTHRQARLRPFVVGGAAYLRELHASKTLAVSGQTYRGGVGVKYFLRERRSAKGSSLGLRGDAMIEARRKGTAFDDAARYHPALAASLFVRF
jgi:hypothetical protein